MKKILFSIYFGVTVLMVSAQTKTHKVTQGQTLYGVAKIYNVTVNDIVKANPGLSASAGLKIGQVIQIPGQGKATATVQQPLSPVTKTDRIHTVARGESLYALSKKYGVKTEDIKKWNGLTGESLHPGQKLIVGKVNSLALYKPVSVPSTPDTPYQHEDTRQRVEIVPQINAPAEKSEPVSNNTGTAATPATNITAAVNTNTTTTAPAVNGIGLKTTSSNPQEYPGIFNQYPAGGYKIKRNRGAANYLADNTSGNQFLAFYDDAETGSIIRVTNMMNKKTIYVKVVGKVPTADASKEVVLKLSNKAAGELGALDDKFLVEVASYSSN